MAPLPLMTGDVLPAGQLARDHGSEVGWEAVRLNRPNMRPWTGVRLPSRPRSWHDMVIFSRVIDGRVTYRSVDREHLLLIRRGSAR